MGEVTAPPSPLLPSTRKLSGPPARMSDTWVLGLVPTLLLALPAGLQQVSFLGGKPVRFGGVLPLWVRGPASGSGSPPTTVRISS